MRRVADSNTKSEEPEQLADIKEDADETLRKRWDCWNCKEFKELNSLFKLYSLY
jgi:hypothetical protein